VSERKKTFTAIATQTVGLILHEELTAYTAKGVEKIYCMHT